MNTLLLHNATLIDGTGADPRPQTSVLVEDGIIRRVASAENIGRPSEGRVIDLAGMTLMPGLTDAHVHFGAVGVNSLTASSPDDNLTTYVISVIENIELALQEGFTTVRDAGGLDPAFARATEEGLIKGPRILPSGSPLSQTGGHGDRRGRYDENPIRSVPGILAAPVLVDGPEPVRAAARQQLRLGASQVKVMASGGVMSPIDALESVQFTVDEMQAAVYEAEMAGKYVLAHCHTSPSVNNALAAGVRSIEHGSILDEETAKSIVEHGAFMVPTLLVMEVLAKSAEAGEIPHYSQMKLRQVHTQMPVSVDLAAHAGVSLGSGTDILGARQSGRGAELSLKARVIGPMDAILSATRTNAQLFRMENRIGCVKEGMEADLIAIAGDPLGDIDVLADGDNVRLVIKGGQVYKETI
ncbi:MAG: amidohydrolase family protein [Chloroflexi bacterium]|nr:amidohydrolase family protein [Chloroflexota bacterium]MCI0877638.1 amidohydrolase family protein [Chloroflexota bacterium]